MLDEAVACTGVGCELESGMEDIAAMSVQVEKFQERSHM